jgi:hypothetical protein
MALNSHEGKRIRHLVSHPGVCSTSISQAIAPGFLNYIKIFTFYFVSLLFLIIF